MKNRRAWLAIGTLVYVLNYVFVARAEAFFADDLRRIIDWYLPWW